MNTLDQQIDYLRKQLGIRDNQVFSDLLNSYSKAQISLQNQLVKQQKRIDKAIDFIKENADYSGINFCSDLRYDECLELLKILKGGE